MTAVRVVSDRYDDYVPLLAASGVEVVDRGAEILLADPALLADVDLAGVRWVQSTWAGVDAIDWTGVPETVTLTTLPGVFGPQMAEFVFGHLLGWTQRVPQRHATRTWDETTPSLIAGSTIGILGAGSIGTAIASVAHAFDMRVTGCRRSGDRDPAFDRMYTISEIDSFVRGLNHLVVVLPATSETRYVVDSDLIELLAPQASLINVGRGSTVVIDAVVAAVKSGQLGLAVLDVTDPEPLPDDHPAWTIPGIVITGHTAAHSRPEDIARFFGDNLARFTDGQQLVGVVDRSRGY